MLLNISEGSKNKNSHFRTFQKAQKMKIHASERFGRFGNKNLMVSSS